MPMAGDLGNFWTRTAPPSGAHLGDLWSDGYQLYVFNGASFVALAGGVFNVKSYGAVGDGLTNDGAAFVTASAAAAATSSATVRPVVVVPSGRYYLGTGVTLPASTSGITFWLESGAVVVWDPDTAGGTNDRTAFTVAGNDVTFDGGEWTSTGAATGVYQRAINCTGARLRVHRMYAHGTGGVAVHVSGNDPEVDNCRFDNTGADNRSSDGGSRYDAGGVYANTSLRPIVRDSLFTNILSGCVTLSATTDALVHGNQMVGDPTNGTSGYVNGVYELGAASGTRVTGNTFRNTTTEHIQFSGIGNAVASGNTFENAFTNANAVGIHVGQSGTGGGSDQTIISDNIFTTANIPIAVKVGRVGVSVDNVIVTGNIFDGPGRLEYAAPGKYLVFADNVCIGNFYVVANAANVGPLSFTGCVFTGYNDPTSAILRIGSALVTDCIFDSITAAGLFERLTTTERDVRVDHCRLTGTGTLRAVVYGTDAGMGAGLGDAWYFNDCDFGVTALTTSTTGSVTPLTVAVPLRQGNTNLLNHFTFDAAVVATTGTVDFPSVGSTASTNPVGLKLVVVGQCAGITQMVTVSAIKQTATLVVGMTSDAASGVAIFASTDFTDTSATNGVLALRYTNSNGATNRISGFGWLINR